MHVAKRFLENNHEVFGIDNLNDYYDVQLKKDRLKKLDLKDYNFVFRKIDITEYEKLSLSYVTGGMTISAAMMEAENANFSTASNEDFEKWTLGASFAF